MCTVESPLHSTLILRYSLEVIVSLIEVASGCDCILFLLVVKLEIHVEIVHSIKCVLSGTRSDPNGIDFSSLIVHADRIIVVFVQVPEG